jgi:hypothetical protein
MVPGMCGKKQVTMIDLRGCSTFEELDIIKKVDTPSGLQAPG